MTRKIYCLEAGLQPYDEMFTLQQKLNQARRKDEIPDVVIFLQHHPCYTIGRKGGSNHILVGTDFLKQHGISVYETDRGGDITYHGPGQLVCYPILDLNNYGRDVHVYARKLEEVLINTLGSFGIAAFRKPGYPGVWLPAGKIGFMGIAIDKWVTMHGVSLNVCPSMHHFAGIIPCGLKVPITSMEEALGRSVEVDQVIKRMCTHFGDTFAVQWQTIDLPTLREMVLV